ncbi:CIA30 family protein [Halochromatium sp.]
MLKPVFFTLLAVTSLSFATTSGLIDDFRQQESTSRLGTDWRLITDQVMGGISAAEMTRAVIDGRPALCLTGTVSLENNGGFVQMSLDLQHDRGLLDASAFEGLRLIVRGDGADYNLHLKTTAIQLPWQSYRAAFSTGPDWKEVRLPFSSFQPHRLVPTLDPARLKRLGIVAIGQAMSADVCIAEIGFY